MSDWSQIPPSEILKNKILLNTDSNGAWCSDKLFVKTKDLFLQGPKTFLHLESHGKISNLMITELFYFLHILNMIRRSFIQGVSGM